MSNKNYGKTAFGTRNQFRQDGYSFVILVNQSTIKLIVEQITTIAIL